MGSMEEKKKTLLIVSQVYVPDSASVGQHMHETAALMVERGWRVIVYASANGYEDPSVRYDKRETRDGVEIRRLPFSSMGKASIAMRLLGGCVFLFQAMLHALFAPRPDVVLVSTSPPMAMIAGVWMKLLRRCAVVFWAMDINPDQMIAMGKIGEHSLPATIFNALDRAILKRADAVVALDHYMAEALERKTPVGQRMHIMPPWPIGASLEPVDHKDNPFRAEHRLSDKFVIMYSGNLSPAHPIDTILEAARDLRDRPQIVFLFIGGGLVRRDIEAYVKQHNLTNVMTLPYQPMDKLRFSLSAADVHLVAMGDAMVGVVHPCKVYGALAVARPVLLVGPKRCHVGEILHDHECGWQVDHGDTVGAVMTIRLMMQTPEHERAAMRQRAWQAAQGELSRATLAGRFCDVLESAAR